jgi:opacity protein-like surface antigen
MKRFLAAVVASAALSTSAALAADANAPSYDNGPVWDYAAVKTKDGHFDDYMKWLSTEWKGQEEALKQAGVIMDYKVLVVTDPRANDPDVFLAQEYRNMAAFDTPVAQQYALYARISGPLVKASKEQEARGAIRTLMGDVMVREAILK